MHILEVRNVTKRYASHTALHDVSLTVPKGSIYGLLGPNGAGKTSLIRIITQITAQDEGQVLFQGQDLIPSHVEQIGYLPEERGLYKKMKVGEQLQYLGRLKGLAQKQVDERLKYWFGKLDIKDWWDKNVEDLSKGMQQKVQFIATVLHQPPLIILDEPFTGFDPVNAAIIRDEILQLRREGATIIFSTHRMETVEELCDHVALINKSKKVLEGTKAAIKAQYKTHTYQVETNVALQGLSDGMEVRSVHEQDGKFVHQIALRAGIHSNELVAAILPQANLLAFGEHAPSMHEIFIAAVGGVVE